MNAFRLLSHIAFGLLVAAVLFAALGSYTAQAGGTVHPPCNEARLRAALAGGGGVGFFCFGQTTISITSPLLITQTTDIEGGGEITLTGGLATQLFDVSFGITLTLHNIVLDSGAVVGVNGGAIHNGGTLVLDNTTIQNSQTDSTRGGGAIFSSGTLSITKSTFKGNHAGDGGAIFINSNVNSLISPAQISNSRFDDNQALNTTTGFGGAIRVGANAALSVVDTKFDSNSAQFGGAIYVTQGSTATFSHGNGSSQGPIFIGNVVTNTNSICGASGTCFAGGAIYNEGAVDVGGYEFFGNATPATVPGVGYGGAIASLGRLSVHDDTFLDNVARFGGALFVGSLTGAPAGSVQTTIDSSGFFLNTAFKLGGGLYSAGIASVVTATHVSFDDNWAFDSGGGAARVDSNLWLLDSSFTNNNATNAGGGLYAASSDTDPGHVVVRSVTFSGNQTIGGNRGGAIANGYSGAAFPNGGLVLLDSVTFFSNTNGIFNSGLFEQTALTNTVLTNAGSLNCDGAALAVVSQGHNFSTDNSCVLNGPGDQKGSGLDAKLGPFQTDGKTGFYLPLAGSPLINAGANCPPRDQRGAARLGPCDIGAVEFGGLSKHNFLPLVRR